MEDIIEELFTLGKAFDEINGFLAPLQLDEPEEHFLKRDYTKQFKFGGE